MLSLTNEAQLGDVLMDAGSAVMGPQFGNIVSGLYTPLLAKNPNWRVAVGTLEVEWIESD